MKRLLALLALLPLFVVASVASAQPVFRGVAWGMSRSEVAATGDSLESFAATAFGLPAVIAYRFEGDRLAGVDVDLTRPFARATIDAANAAYADMLGVYDSLATRFDYAGENSGLYRPGRDCSDGMIPQLVSGCMRFGVRWSDAATIAEEVIDGITGRILHTVALRASALSAAPDESRPTALDLR